MRFGKHEVLRTMIRDIVCSRSSKYFDPVTCDLIKRVEFVQDVYGENGSDEFVNSLRDAVGKIRDEFKKEMPIEDGVMASVMVEYPFEFNKPKNKLRSNLLVVAVFFKNKPGCECGDSQ